MHVDRRCVVTGLGVVSSVGIGKDAFWDSLTHGRSGVSRITYFDTSKLPVHHAGEVKGFNAAEYVDDLRLEMTGRYVHFAVAASKMALQDAGITPGRFDKTRLAVTAGTTSPACDAIEKHLYEILAGEGADGAPPYTLASIVVHAATAEVSQTLNLFDSATTVTTVCTSGTNAIGTAFNDIRSGRRDIVLAGSSESTITYFTFISYIAAGLLVKDEGLQPEKIMRPFDKNRCGGVMSEGAAFVVLEELDHAKARGAHIYGEIVGYSWKDRFIGPKSTKQTMINAMRGAVENARVSPDDVDYVSANGTSTVIHDKVETAALKEVFGRRAYRIPISAIKSMIGIPNSAIGPMQLIAALLSFETDVIPPTINYETPDPECDLDYVPNTARYNRVNVALINNYGMDGACASLITKRYRNSKE